MIKLGISTWLWTDRFSDSHCFAVDAAGKMGCDVIEFSIMDPDVFPTEKIMESLKAYDMIPVTSTVLLEGANPISEDEALRKNAVGHMKKIIDITKRLGAKTTAGVNYAASGYMTGKLRTEREVELSVSCMKEAARYAAETSDIVIALEPVKRFESHFLNRAEQALEYIEIAGCPNLGVQLDTFHMNIEERDPIEAILSCGDKLKHMHLCENNRGTPGMGHIPWADVFKALKKIGFNGTTAMEAFNLEALEEWFKYEFQSQMFADTNKEFAEKGLRHLRAVNTIVFGE